MPTNSNTSLKTIVDFARRKGFVYPSSEIYGGFAATYDFGPLGHLLKQNLVKAWRDYMINYRTDTVEIEGAIFLHPKVWEASGHIGGFSDLLVEDLITKKRYRADHLVEEAGVVWPLEIQNSKSKIQKVGLSVNSKVILIDAINTLIIKNGEELSLNKELFEYLQTRNERKIVVTNAKGEILEKIKNLLVSLFRGSAVGGGVTHSTFELFSLEFNPEKTDPKYFETLLQQFDLQAKDCFYFDHSQANLDSSKEVGIEGTLFENNEQIIGVLGMEFPVLNENNNKGTVLTDAGSLTSEEIDQIIEYYNLKSPDGNPLSKAKKFNLLVKTHLGPIEDESSLAYLKGEACQNIYVDWKAVQETTRRKIPFGIGQLGKAFRNEITVKQFMFRTREFEQIDMQYFVKPPEFVKKDENGKNLEKDHFEWFAYWKEERYNFYTQFLGYNPENLNWHQHTPEELVFYAAEAWDVYYHFGQMGYKEMEGIHNRTDYDTRQHQKFSGTDLTYLDPETNQRYLPYIVEMSLGVNRLFLSSLFEFYREEEIVNPENAELDEQIKGLEKILKNLKN